MRFVLMAIFALQLSCRTTNSQDAEVNSASLPTGSPQEIVDQPVWNAYVAEEESRYEHQDACRPASFRHRGSLRGLVVLLHGFTACAQQYFELGPLLAAEGFDVLLPVNPGHGMIRGPKEWAHLPDHSTYKQKSPDFVANINHIVRSYPAPVKVIGGLSLGATYATAAIIAEPELYSRGLIMVPLYRMSGLIAHIVGGAKNVSNFSQKILPDAADHLIADALSKKIGWGPKCGDEIRAGRQGICDFNFTHLVAAQQFGWDLSKNHKIRGQLQFIAVENDPAVDNGRIKWFYEKKVESKQSQAALCFYPQGANHSLASRYDAYEQKKFWMNDFQRDLVAFVSRGKFFRTDTSRIDGYPKCASPKS